MCLRASYLKTVPHQKQTLFNYKFLGKRERASNIDSLLSADCAVAVKLRSVAVKIICQKHSRFRYFMGNPVYKKDVEIH